MNLERCIREKIANFTTQVTKSMKLTFIANNDKKSQFAISFRYMEFSLSRFSVKTLSREIPFAGYQFRNFLKDTSIDLSLEFPRDLVSGIVTRCARQMRKVDFGV